MNRAENGQKSNVQFKAAVIDQQSNHAEREEKRVREREREIDGEGGGGCNASQPARESVLCKYELADVPVTNHEVGAATCGWRGWRRRLVSLWRGCKF